jgi:hypothetical protein
MAAVFSSNQESSSCAISLRRLAAWLKREAHNFAGNCGTPRAESPRAAGFCSSQGPPRGAPR